MITVTNKMLQAAMNVAVERGLLPKYAPLEKNAENWATVKKMLEAAIEASYERGG